MSLPTVNDYLTKQIFIEKNIVTYRSLSRELRLHVNTAKNELATFHENAPYDSLTSHATFLLCGEVAGFPGSQDLYMDHGAGEDPEGNFEDDGDEVQQTRILLVNESDLEDAKQQFTHLSTIHIYSLSPSPIRDADLICTPTDLVRAADHGKQAKEMASIVGKVVGSGIQAQYTSKKTKTTRPNAAGPSRPKPASPSKTLGATSVAESAKEEKKPLNRLKERPKATGKLNFFKANEKALEVPNEKSKVQEQTNEVKKEPSVPTVAPETKVARQTLEPTKRGTKRKSIASAQEQEEDVVPIAAASKLPSKPPSKEKVRLQNRTVLSEDEDETPKPTRKPRKSRGSPLNSDVEDVEAMMDIDDDQVDRVTREPLISHKNEEDEDEEGEATGIDHEDLEALNLNLPKTKPKKRREKKVVPVGRNGLKKKRVVKSRNKMDEKGYMIFEDYSDYESVEEEESEATPAKGKAKAKRSAKVKLEEEEDDDSPAPDPTSKLKPTTKGASSKAAKTAKSKANPKQGKLANFFMAKPKN